MSFFSSCLRAVLLLLLLQGRTVAAFCNSPFQTSSSSIISRNNVSGNNKDLHKLNAWVITENMDLAEKMEVSRFLFYFWFFGASGAAGIGRRAFPAFYRKEKEKIELANMENAPTLGGEDLGLSPLNFFPTDLKVLDVERIVNQKLSIEEIVTKYPVEDNLFSRKGYLTWDAFNSACIDAKCNPLAARAIFDTLNRNQNTVEPFKAQDKIDSYKMDVSKVKSELLVASITRFSAILGLCGLLFLADYEAFIVHAFSGWFPTWQGFQNIPASLLDPDTGLLALPNYYMWDIPTPEM